MSVRFVTMDELAAGGTPRALPLPEAVVMHLREYLALSQEPCPYVLGDIVCVRDASGSSSSVLGEPMIVMEVLLPSEPKSQPAANVTMRIAYLDEEGDIVERYVEHWRVQPWDVSKLRRGER